MKREVLEIYNNETLKIEQFVECLCRENHIHNYLGSISVALLSAVDLTEGKLNIIFQKDKKGVCFTIESEDKYFALLSEDIQTENNSLFLIKSLSDEISVTQEGKVLTMSFYVSGISPELAVKRKELINTYSSYKRKKLQTL